MENYNDFIDRVMTNFYKTSLIESLFFTNELSIVTLNFREHSSEDLFSISQGEIEGFLKSMFEKRKEHEAEFYTYYLRENLFCIVSFLYIEGNCAGAFVTQPLALNVLKSERIEKAANKGAEEAASMERYMASMLRAPVVPHDRIVPLGEFLCALSRSETKPLKIKQVFAGGDASTYAHKLMESGRVFTQREKSQYGGWQAYMGIKDSISKGDITTLEKIIEDINIDKLNLVKYNSDDAIRSLKNNLIIGCAMCSFAAIEAGVSYDEGRDLADKFVEEIEKTSNINNLYMVMRSALLSFTRSVALMRIRGYSKYVKYAIEYIEKNYNSKVTLKDIADAVGISQSYLSGLIKKETGLNINDIINKIRIKESKKILLNSSMSIAELSSVVGYSYSNHFSRVFRQQTGMTPSEFLKINKTTSEVDTKNKEILTFMLDQLHHTMSLFDGVFDVGRIVDPVSSMAWNVQATGNVTEDTCYNFWKKNQSCSTCISNMAIVYDKSYVKIEKNKGTVFLVIATPIVIGRKKYVVELLKTIDDNLFNISLEQ